MATGDTSQETCIYIYFYTLCSVKVSGKRNVKTFQPSFAWSIFAGTSNTITSKSICVTSMYSNARSLLHDEGLQWKCKGIMTLHDRTGSLISIFMLPKVMQSCLSLATSWPNICTRSADSTWNFASLAEKLLNLLEDHLGIESTERWIITLTELNHWSSLMFLVVSLPKKAAPTIFWTVKVCIRHFKVWVFYLTLLLRHPQIIHQLIPLQGFQHSSINLILSNFWHTPGDADAM